MIAASVAKSNRPKAARALDESHKPAKVLAFIGLKPGDAAVDLVSGGGYWAEILAGAVGKGGTVTALEPEQFYDEEVWNALKERHPDIKLESYRFEKLHRIDPAAARKDFEEAGFVFEAESDMLANANDPRDISVFDPAIRGKTDRFVYRFRKPAS